MTAVSYTHLDVYKRQVPILCLGKKWLVFDRSLLKKTISYGWASAMQQATVQPVSYTHLDVYKRQIPARIPTGPSSKK